MYVFPVETGLASSQGHSGSPRGSRPDIQEKMALSLVNSTSPACTNSPKPSRHIGAGLMSLKRRLGPLPLGEWGAGGTAPRVYGCFKVP